MPIPNDMSLREMLTPSFRAPIVESTFSDVVESSFDTIVDRVKELELCDHLLGEVLATLTIERNRQSAKENPEQFVAVIFPIVDRWNARRKAIGK